MEANLLFFAVGAFLLSGVLMNVFFYLKIFRPALQLEKKGYKVMGTLIRVDRVRKGKSVGYYAVVQYRTLSGQNMEGRSVLSIKRYIKEVNVPMEIVYNTNKEEQFMPTAHFNPKIYKMMLFFLNFMLIGMFVFLLFQLGIVVL